MEGKPTTVDKKQVENEEKFDFETKIFALDSEDKSDHKNLGIFKKIKAQFQNCLYCRFNKGKGHIAFKASENFKEIFPSLPESETKEEETKPEPESKTNESKKSESSDKKKVLGQLTVELEKEIEGESNPTKIQLKVNILEMSDSDKEQFWRAHGKHFDSLLKRSLGQAIKYKPDGNACFSNKNVFLAGLKFKTLNEVRNFFKKLLKSKKPKDKVEGIDSRMLEELIRFHPKHKEKIQDFEGFVVDFHPKFPETKCFLVQAKDNVTRDFSYVKCIKFLADSLN